MIPWKKKQPPVQHHDTNHEKIVRLEARIAKLEAQPSITLYKLDAGEDVLVQCVVGDERVVVPLSQIIAHAMPEIASQVEQAMVTKLKVAGMPRSRTVKTLKQQPESEQKL